MKPSLLIGCLAALSAVACGGAADIPDTPDLRGLIRDYEAPTASLDATSAAQTLHGAPALDELSTGFLAAQNVLDSDVNQASKTSSGSTGSRIRLQGSIGLQIRCPGEASQPNLDESVNGSISITLAIADTKIRRSFGGDAKHCALQGTRAGRTVRVELDGQVAFDLGNDIGIGQRWSGKLLASLPGTLTVDGHEFRSISGLLSDGVFQYLVNVDSGTVVLQLGGDDVITVRDGNGTWFCREGEPCAMQ
ncbi:MAG TPA: hypothetical protein VER96_01125 [Polyangiaceae bacterium]|nr:hypothetical protein [Polyangiaceae bacterium]